MVPHLSALTTSPDPLLGDPDGVHAAAIAALPPIPLEQRARIRALARAADPFVNSISSLLRGAR
ncbi:MAG: hypothetical protein J0J03_03845 [Leifsonia sp.]|nr:hypothetical protein [Leifsonia sp.]